MHRCKIRTRWMVALFLFCGKGVWPDPPPKKKNSWQLATRPWIPFKKGETSETGFLNVGKKFFFSRQCLAKCQFFVVQPPPPLHIFVTSDASETISCDIHNCVRRRQGERKRNWPPPLTAFSQTKVWISSPLARNKISSLWICVSKRVYLRVYEQQQHNSLEKCFRNLAPSFFCVCGSLGAPGF